MSPRRCVAGWGGAGFFNRWQVPFLNLWSVGGGDRQGGLRGAIGPTGQLFRAVTGREGGGDNRGGNEPIFRISGKKTPTGRTISRGGNGTGLLAGWSGPPNKIQSLSTGDKTIEVGYQFVGRRAKGAFPQNQVSGCGGLGAFPSKPLGLTSPIT